MASSSEPAPSAVELSELWAIQESLLQAYRTVFITAESVIFAIAAIALALTPHWPALPLIALGLYLIYVWMAVCNARALAVTFIHWMMQRYEDGEPIPQPYRHFRTFQSTRRYNDIDVLTDPTFRDLSNSTTRKRMDVEVPVAFGLMWLVLLTILIVSLCSGPA